MKRAASKTDINLDSLLDTLTNVVGFLLILLVTLQLDVDRAVTRISASCST